MDRATEPLRHANIYGVDPRGGMLLLVGDDPGAKSSTVPAVSERSLAALGIPVLFPRTAREIVTMGMRGVAMSRASGCVVVLKIRECGRRCLLSRRQRRRSSTSAFAKFIGKADRSSTVSCRWASATCLDAEVALYGPRAQVVCAYGAANGLDVIELDPPSATIGMAATGTTFDSLRQAIADLGADDFALTATLT